MDRETIISNIIEAAVLVKRSLGIGFLESVYQRALAHELRLRGFATEIEYPLEVRYKDAVVGTFRADIFVEKSIIVETKMADCIIKPYECQLVNYLTACNIDDGLIINFSSTPIEIKRKFRTTLRRNTTA